MAKVLLVLYLDPIHGFPPAYARNSERHHRCQWMSASSPPVASVAPSSNASPLRRGTAFHEDIRTVVKVPDDFPHELAGPLGCGIQTGAGAIMRTFNAPAGSSVVIASATTERFGSWPFLQTRTRFFVCR